MTLEVYTGELTFVPQPSDTYILQLKMNNTKIPKEKPFSEKN